MAVTRSGSALTRGVAVVAPVLLCLAACTTTPTPASRNVHPTTSPKPSVTVTSAFPNLTGVQFDQSLRHGNTTLPKLGRLLAATQTGGPRHLTVDLTGVQKVIGVYVCRGDGAVKAQVVRGKLSLLKVWSGGCNPTNLYSGQSDIPVGGNAAEVTITVPDATAYAFVLEEVDTGKRTT